MAGRCSEREVRRPLRYSRVLDLRPVLKMPMAAKQDPLHSCMLLAQLLVARGLGGYSDSPVCLELTNGGGISEEAKEAGRMKTLAHEVCPPSVLSSSYTDPLDKCSAFSRYLRQIEPPFLTLF